MELQKTLEIPLPRLAALLSNHDFKTVPARSRSTTTWSRRIRAVVGTLSLDELTGNLAACSFDRFAMETDCDVSLKNQVSEIKRPTATLKPLGLAGAALDITGTYDLAKNPTTEVAYHSLPRLAGSISAGH